MNLLLQNARLLRAEPLNVYLFVIDGHIRSRRGPELSVW